MSDLQLVRAGPGRRRGWAFGELGLLFAELNIWATDCDALQPPVSRVTSSQWRRRQRTHESASVVTVQGSLSRIVKGCWVDWLGVAEGTKAPALRSLPDVLLHGMHHSIMQFNGVRKLPVRLDGSLGQLASRQVASAGPCVVQSGLQVI